MGLGVWLVGCADQPHPKISFFRASGGSQASGFLKVVKLAAGNLDHWLILYNNARFNTLYVV